MSFPLFAEMPKVALMHNLLPWVGLISLTVSDNRFAPGPGRLAGLGKIIISILLRDEEAMWKPLERSRAHLLESGY